MSVDYIAPILQPNQVARFYLSPTTYPKTSNYPGPGGWDVGFQPSDNFFAPSYGHAVNDSALRYSGVGTTYNGFFSAISNIGWGRCTFSIADGVAHNGFYNPIYNYQDGKIYAGFWAVSGVMLTAQVFASVNSIDLNGGEIGHINMVEVFNDTYDCSFGRGDSMARTYLMPLPANAPNTIGIAANCDFAPFYHIRTFKEINTGNLYNFGLTTPSGGELPALDGRAVIWYDGDYRAFSFSEGPSDQKVCVEKFVMGTTNEPYPAPQYQELTWVLVGFANYVYFSRGQFWRDKDGYLYALDTRDLHNLAMWQFNSDCSEMRTITFQAADDATKAFLDNPPVTTANYFAFSVEGNTPILTSGLPGAALYYTFAPVINVAIAGPGPNLPLIGLACQNYCLPMFRMEKL